MATTPTRGKNTRPAQSLSLLLWQDTLLNWGIPLLLAGAMVIVAVLGGFEQIAQSTGVVALGWLSLLLLLFFLLQAALSGLVDSRLKFWILVFGLAWVAITWAQVYFTVFVGQEMFAGSIGTEGPGVALALGVQGTAYDLVIEGNFVPVTGEVGREASYDLSLEKDGQKIQDFLGTFSERWGRQRLGRRGSAYVRQLHNHGVHRFLSPGEGTYQLKVVRIDPQLTPTLHVTLYRDIYPEKIFWGLNAFLLIGAYVLEFLLTGKEVPLVLGTAAALAFVLIFPQLGAPPHTYQNLIGAIMIAAIAGPLGGWIFRSLADTIRKSLGLSKPRPAVALQGKEKGKKARG